MKTYKMIINGDKYTTKIKEYKGHEVIVEVNGTDYLIEMEIEKPAEISLIRSQKAAPQIKVTNPLLVQTTNTGAVTAPIPGTINAVLIKEGDLVKEGETVIILEAMKMESEITATISGKVKKILVKEGSAVIEGEILLEIEE